MQAWKKEKREGNSFRWQREMGESDGSGNCFTAGGRGGQE